MYWNGPFKKFINLNFKNYTQEKNYFNLKYLQLQNWIYYCHTVQQFYALVSAQKTWVFMHTKSYTWMFVSALLVIDNSLK